MSSSNEENGEQLTTTPTGKSDILRHGTAVTYEQAVSANCCALDPPAAVVEPCIIGDLMEDQLREFARAMGEPEPTVYDVLAAALAAQIVDPILLRIKARSQVVEIINKLANLAELVTGIGGVLEVTVGGEPVRADRDFSKYTTSHFAEITTKVRGRIDTLVSSAKAISELHVRMTQLREADATKIKTLTESALKLAIINDGKIAELRESVVRTNTMLEAYHDQPIFVVAKVGPDGKPQTFLRIDQDGVVGVTEYGAATKWRHFKGANAKRVEVLREKRAPAAGALRRLNQEIEVGSDGEPNPTATQIKKKVDLKHRLADITKTYVVLQANLRMVTLSDVDEE